MAKQYGDAQLGAVNMRNLSDHVNSWAKRLGMSLDDHEIKLVMGKAQQQDGPTCYKLFLYTENTEFDLNPGVQRQVLNELARAIQGIGMAKHRRLGCEQAHVSHAGDLKKLMTVGEQGVTAAALEFTSEETMLCCLNALIPDCGKKLKLEGQKTATATLF